MSPVTSADFTQVSVQEQTFIEEIRKYLPRETINFPAKERVLQAIHDAGTVEPSLPKGVLPSTIASNLACVTLPVKHLVRIIKEVYASDSEKDLLHRLQKIRTLLPQMCNEQGKTGTLHSAFSPMYSALERTIDREMAGLTEGSYFLRGKGFQEIEHKNSFLTLKEHVWKSLEEQMQKTLTVFLTFKNAQPPSESCCSCCDCETSTSEEAGFCALPFVLKQALHFELSVNERELLDKLNHISKQSIPKLRKLAQGKPSADAFLRSLRESARTVRELRQEILAQSEDQAVVRRSARLKK